MKILVCGGRHYNDAGCVDRYLTQLQPTCVIEGGATGADRIASDWAFRKGVDGHRFYAEWGQHGKAAGPKRNQRMIDEGKPDLVLAFPGGRGTADMVQRAKAAGVKVIEVS